MKELINFINNRLKKEHKNSSPRKTNRNHNSCPNCGVIFDPIPKRKTKCLSCGIEVYIRSNQELFNSDLLTEDQAYTADFFKELENIGVTKDRYTAMKNKLSAKWGFKAKPYDIIWNLSTAEIVESTKNYRLEEYFRHASMIYMAQANFLENRNKDPYTPRLLMNESDLERFDYNKNIVMSVKINLDNCCDECRLITPINSSARHYLSLKLLPYQKCTRKLRSRDKHSWCICYYSPVIKHSKG